MSDDLNQVTPREFPPWGRRQVLEPRGTRAPLARFTRFGCVGLTGFVIDLGVLHLAMGSFGINPYVGRSLSFLCAVAVTWMLNRHWTFADRSRGTIPAEFGRYLVASAGAGTANLLVYTGLLASMPVISVTPGWAVVAGTVSGLLINFVSYDRAVFSRSNPTASAKHGATS
jgi:putative flippase GtrA